MENFEIINRFKHLFWQYRLDSLSVDKHKEFIIHKVLCCGTISDINELRDIFGDKEIREVILKSKGRGIEKRRLRFFETIFDLPHEEVDRWLADPLREIWDR